MFFRNLDSPLKYDDFDIHINRQDCRHIYSYYLQHLIAIITSPLISIYNVPCVRYVKLFPQHFSIFQNI